MQGWPEVMGKPAREIFQPEHDEDDMLIKYDHDHDDDFLKHVDDDNKYGDG